MFEDVGGGDAPADAVPEPAAPVTAAMLRCWIAGLTGVDRAVDDAERVTQLELLERLKSAAAAARAVAYRLDPRAFVDRTRGASKDRTVTLRPAPDTHVEAVRVPAGRPGRRRAHRAVEGGRPAPRRRRRALPRPDHGRHPGP